MMWTKKWFNQVSLILFVLLYSGCLSLDPNLPTDIVVGSTEEEVIDEIVSEDVVAHEKPVQAAINSSPSISDDIVPPNEETSPSFEKGSDNPDSINTTPYSTDQELIDAALEYCQASNDFWELG